jgi:hypothetical protein
VTLEKPDVSEEYIASIFRVERISKRGITLAVSQLLVTLFLLHYSFPFLCPLSLVYDFY